MSEMVERVAKAICEKAAEIDRRPFVLSTDPRAATAGDEYARAAIEAMRDPTKDKWHPVGEQEIWRSMIDAALK